MSSLNKVILIGRLGKDAEIRATPAGQPVANFILATNEAWTDPDGTRQERTEWHRVVAWNRLSEVGKYLTKGRQVYVEGTVRTRDWTDNEGISRRAMEIVATRIILLDSRARDPQPQTEETPAAL